MIYLNVLGQPFIILSSLEVITDLLEKRSSNYSDRIHMTMMNDLYVTYLSVQKTRQKCLSMQNEFAYSFFLDAIRPLVATTQEIISPVFQS